MFITCLLIFNIVFVFTYSTVNRKPYKVNGIRK
jgi:hypothetical protein